MLWSTERSAVASHQLGWWWWWRRRTASSWEPAATRRSALQSQRCSWCEPGGRRRSPWCSGGPLPWAGSARCCGKARSAGSPHRRARHGSACRRRWRWCHAARRCPPASSSPGWPKSRWWRISHFGGLKEDLGDERKVRGSRGRHKGRVEAFCSNLYDPLAKTI